MAASPAPHEQQQETEENHSEESDAAHRRGNQDGGEVQGELEKNASAVQIGVVQEFAAVQRAVEEEGRRGVQWLTTYGECGEVRVVASGVAGDADVRSSVSKLGVANLQGSTWEDGNPSCSLCGDPSALWGNPDNSRRGFSFSSTQKTHLLAFTSDYLWNNRNTGVKQ